MREAREKVLRKLIDASLCVNLFTYSRFTFEDMLWVGLLNASRKKCKYDPFEALPNMGINVIILLLMNLLTFLIYL